MPACRRRRPACRGRCPARLDQQKTVPIVALFVNTIVCRRLQVAAGCMQEVAACMQASCNLHTIVRRRLQVAVSCMQDAAGCMHAACSLHAACMQPACISSGALALLSILHMSDMTCEYLKKPGLSKLDRGLNFGLA